MDELDKNLKLRDIEDMERARRRDARLRRSIREDSMNKTGSLGSRKWEDFELQLLNGVDLNDMEEHISDERAKAERIHEAIDAANARGELSDFNTEMYHDWANRSMAHKETAWGMGSVGLSNDIIKKDITEPWDRILRQVSAWDKSNPMKEPDDEEEEEEESAAEEGDDGSHSDYD